MPNTTPKLFFAVLYPSIFVGLMWAVWLFERITHIDLGYYGLFPRTLHGLLGIVTSPLIHGDINHIVSNTLPMLILGTVMFYFYRPIAFQVFFWIYLMTGIWVWVAARPAYHIGASGLIYGFVTFIFFSGILRKDVRLLALSLFVTFLYGSTAYGVLPLKSSISWESHLLGSIAGFITAFHFRKEGPKAKEYDFGEDEEDEEYLPEQEHEATDSINHQAENTTNSQTSDITVHYNYVPKEEKEEGD